jgi:hypothetical protein
MGVLYRLMMVWAVLQSFGLLVATDGISWIDAQQDAIPKGKKQFT